MEGSAYTRLDRGNLFRTLESRLSASHCTFNGPQVQLFRVRTSAPTMPNLMRDERVYYEEASRPSSLVSPTGDFSQVYNERLRAMQAMIDQLQVAEKERQRWDENVRAAQKELERARIELACLEKQVGDSAVELREAVERRNITNLKEEQHSEAAQETGDGCLSPQNADTNLTKPLAILKPPTGEAEERPNEGVISLHHIAWGSRSIHDKLLEGRLMNCATQGHSFVATRDFIGHDTGPGERKTLVIAYSKLPDGPLRWLVVDEGGKGGFDLE
ncbi:hypothetical protein Hte_002591 [Hypoxylon texense]